MAGVMLEACVVCQSRVRPRQEGLMCDRCHRWQHRTCDSGVSRSDYRQLVKGEIQIRWDCRICTDLPDVIEDHSIIEDLIEMDDGGNADVPDIEDDGDVMEEQPSLNASFNITAVIDGDVPEIQELPLPDRSMSDTVLEERHPEFQVIENGTKRGGKKLVNSEGYSYVLKRSSQRRTIWTCAIKNKSLRCYAMVYQMGDEFINKALWQALRTVIPDITLKGCIFHWSQCVWRKIQNLGLQPTYTERQGPFIFMRKLMALPFLPAAHIDAAFRAIRERANTPQLVELTNYIAEQWMESQVYPMSSLSVYNYVIRTNNDVEGWHRRMNSRANGQGLAFYTLVPYLRKEAEHVKVQVRLVQDNLMSRDNRRKYRRIQAKLEDLWGSYSTGALNTSNFLLKAAAVYGKH